MTKQEWMNEGIDLKLTMLLYRKKIWISIVGALAGAVFAGGLYFLLHVVYAPAREYEAVSELYLTFAKDDDGDAYQYYNGYTWNDLMGTEPILDRIMEELSDTALSREQVRAAVSADILSDIRLLTVTVATNQLDESEKIIRAAEKALIGFGEEMIEFDRIEVIGHGQAQLVVVEDETVRAVVAGAVIGFLLSLIGLAFAYVVDDSIYVPSDFEKRYGYPVLGVRFAGNEALGQKELWEHIQLVKEKKKEVQIICLTSLPEALDALKQEEYKKTGAIFEIPYGRGNGKLIECCMAEAAFLEREIVGAVIMDAEERLYRQYFATFACGRKQKKTERAEKSEKQGSGQ